MLLADRAEGDEFADARVGEDDVDASFLLPDLRVDPVQVGEVGDVSLDGGGAGADGGRRCV